jgi:hypothetical protein
MEMEVLAWDSHKKKNCEVKLLNEIPTLLSDNWISNNNTDLNKQ